MENERDALIALYFDLGMTYRDLLCTLAHRHNVILSERQLKGTWSDLICGVEDTAI